MEKIILGMIISLNAFAFNPADNVKYQSLATYQRQNNEISKLRKENAKLREKLSPRNIKDKGQTREELLAINKEQKKLIDRMMIMIENYERKRPTCKNRKIMEMIITNK